MPGRQGGKSSAEKAIVSAPCEILSSRRLDTRPVLAGSGRAEFWVFHPPQERDQQRQNNDQHEAGEKQNLIALRVAMVPFVVRLVVHFGHHLAKTAARGKRFLSKQ